MALNPIIPGLRSLRYDSNQVAKVQINVQPGDELRVSEDLAGQLQRADSHFKDVDPPSDDATEDEPSARPRRRPTTAK